MMNVFAYTRYRSIPTYADIQRKCIRFVANRTPELMASKIRFFNDKETSVFTALPKRPAWLDLVGIAREGDVILVSAIDVIGVDVEALAGLAKRLPSTIQIITNPFSLAPAETTFHANLAAIYAERDYSAAGRLISQGLDDTAIMTLLRLPRDAVSDIRARQYHSNP